ncbi:MAG TPA: DUF6176 family protein [Rhabdochlamydiaceae bacterium]|jgi:D-alanyl-D-alanine dipeptidase
MVEHYSQVICTYSKIKEGCVEKVKAWLSTIQSERREETLQSFSNEGVWLEAAFIREAEDGLYLVYFMRAQNVKQALAAFQNSTLPIDIFHRECCQQLTEGHEILTTVYHLEAELKKPEEILVDVIALSQKKCASPLQGLLAYATGENFLGRVVDGYSPHAAHVCLLGSKAAEQLCCAQNALNAQGLGLFIFDAFRPLRAVRDFSTWYNQPPASAYEIERKALHYPRLEKTDLTRLGYAPDKVSRHCFGGSVDLTLIDLTTSRLLNMGTLFDYFDPSSHHPAALPTEIGEEAFHNRELLAKIMREAGFVPYPLEYWHFDYHEQPLKEPADLEITPSLLGLNVK